MPSWCTNCSCREFTFWNKIKIVDLDLISRLWKDKSIGINSKTSFLKVSFFHVDWEYTVKNDLRLIPRTVFSGTPYSNKSINIVHVSAQVLNFTVELLNSLHPTGISANNLQLKIGASMMLLRNLDPPRLCNWTRLLVKKLQPNLIKAMVMTGCAK